jgi:hypothetical protein
MLETDNLYAAERIEMGSLEDVPYPWMEAQLFKTVYQLLLSVLEEEEDLLEEVLEEAPAETPARWTSLDEFRVENLFDYTTEELLDCYGYDSAYIATIVRSHSDPQFQAVVIRTRSGNPMGRVFYREENEAVYEYYDGSVNTFDIPETKQGEAQALTVLTSTELGLSIADWKTTPAGLQSLESLSAL